MSDTVETLKAEISQKDRRIRILKAEIDNLKKYISENTSDALGKKIKFYENELMIKDKELRDLKNVSSPSGDLQEMKTKMIILQSKIRKSNQDLESYKIKNEDLSLKVRRLEKQLRGSQAAEQLSGEIEQYKKTIASYKATISDLTQSANQAKSLEQEVFRLQRELKQSPRRSSNEMSEFQPSSGSPTVQRMKRMIEERDQTILQLEQRLNSSSGASGPSFLSTNRVNRRVNELEAQVKMLKKNEADMKKRYEDAMRKLAMKNEFDGW